jgi:hypothetical protein
LENIGFWLTALWLLVLFAGGAWLSKTHYKNARNVIVVALVAIPVIYILVWAVL